MVVCRDLNEEGLRGEAEEKRDAATAARAVLAGAGGGGGGRPVDSAES